MIPASHSATTKEPHRGRHATSSPATISTTPTTYMKACGLSGTIRVATGEHVPNRVVFKQLLQADALAFVQIDATRVAGVNENLAVLLLAAKFGKPVCPHAGGDGLGLGLGGAAAATPMSPVTSAPPRQSAAAPAAGAGTRR